MRANPDKPELDRHIGEELDTPPGTRRRHLLPDEAIERFGITPEPLDNLRLGHNRKGFRLKYIRVGNKTVRNRPRDVLEFDWRCLKA